MLHFSSFSVKFWFEIEMRKWALTDRRFNYTKWYILYSCILLITTRNNGHPLPDSRSVRITYHGYMDHIEIKQNSIFRGNIQCSTWDSIKFTFRLIDLAWLFLLDRQINFGTSNLNSSYKICKMRTDVPVFNNTSLINTSNIVKPGVMVEVLQC